MNDATQPSRNGGSPDPATRGIPQKGAGPTRVTDPSRYQHAERAGHPETLPTGSEPAHVQAAAQAAGADRPAAGPLGIGVAGPAGAAATQGQGRAEGHPRPGLVAAFDDHHPPDPELIADCVHCGFCLPTCPTYLLWGEEMDSPRGRIYLMKLAAEGEIGLTNAFTRHIDLCLGCMACVTACPSGVQYEKLIETTRAQIERRYHRSLPDRLFRSLVFALFPHPGRLRALLPLLWVYQRSGARRLLRSPLATRRLPDRLLALDAVLPPVHLRALVAGVPRLTRASAPRRRRVGLLTGCVQRVFFDPVNAATIRVLAAEGCEVVAPPGQGCCGALCFHAGREGEGLAYARRLIDAFAPTGVETIVVNAAGCGSTLKEYGYLLRDDPVYAERAQSFSAKVRDITELLAELEPVAPRRPVPLRVAYHDACHLGHAQGVRRQPRTVLHTIPGLDLLDIPEADICCGSAGIYNLVEPEAAEQLGERKARHILETRPDVIATGNPGCLLQINAALQRLGVTIPLVHPVELVDASIRGALPARWSARSSEPVTPATVG
jgi:glycolate oxidase iron-sulfur subunit